MLIQLSGWDSVLVIGHTLREKVKVSLQTFTVQLGAPLLQSPYASIKLTMQCAMLKLNKQIVLIYKPVPIGVLLLLLSQ
jgi:hypothetical protein